MRNVVAGGNLLPIKIRVEYAAGERRCDERLVAIARGLQALIGQTNFVELNECCELYPMNSKTMEALGENEYFERLVGGPATRDHSTMASKPFLTFLT